ncbi:hypothetical protein N7540_007833 [Penicillium herquei]|nr:hypothetical protein N7540_007833 [Penicillium herquei]
MSNRHADHEIQNLDEFIRFASNVSSLADEDRALVLSLAKKMSSNIHGAKCPAPKHMFRCDGVFPPMFTKTTSERSAMIMRFPYSSIHKLDAATRSSEGLEPVTKTLIQYNYPFRSTKKRDLDQVVQKTGLFPSGHVVHIQELWTALRYHISKNCLPIGFKDRGYDFELLAADGNVVKAEDWPKISSTHSSTVLYLQVRPLYPEPQKKSEPNTGTKGSVLKESKASPNSRDKEKTDTY